ncbi:MAG: hypothetical protein D6695_02830 [Planctomycetota bacterium]|nr:MAG: hypothetical protein D6695_02830 [Planctomycetota bacterium]
MRMAPTHIRLLAAALVATAIPTCCCTGRLLSDVLIRLGNPQNVVFALGGTVQQSTEHSEPSSGCCGKTPDESAPARPSHDDKPCDCDRFKPVKNLPEVPGTLELTPPAFAMKPTFRPVTLRPQVLAQTTDLHTAFDRPPTTLLRLRCALIL